MEAVARAYKALLVAQYGAAYYVQMQEAWKENQYQRANAERVYLLAWYKAYFDQFEKIQDDDDPRLQEYKLLNHQHNNALRLIELASYLNFLETASGIKPVQP